MTKSELIKRIAAHYPNIYLKDVHAIVDTIFDEISSAMIESRRVELRGFGAFSVRRRKARTARNPRTNEVVQLDQRLAPYFRAGKELRERLNEQQDTQVSSAYN